MLNLQQQLEQLIRVGSWIQSNRWCPATSGNLSTRVVGEQRFHISRSGKYKGELGLEDFLAVDFNGNVIDDVSGNEQGNNTGNNIGTKGTPSAETLLHALIYERHPEAAFVLHSHSVYGTVLSRSLGEGDIVFRDYELQKAFAGIDTHDTQFIVPVFSNSQDMAFLASKIARHMDDRGVAHCFVLAGHGIYTWGSSIADAKRHLEALEFLFECEYKSRLLAK